MHLLLPPSEAKRPGGRGRSLRARGDDGPLAAERRSALDALDALVEGPADAAAAALLLPPGVAAKALAANARVRDSPTMPALRRYAGVVYDGLDLEALTPAEQRLAARSVHVFSGLFGVLRGDELVPDYRVPAKAVLPGLGIAASFWRPVLASALAGPLRRGLIVDLRSSDYRAMWRPDPATSSRVLGVRILSPAPRGGHAVISFTSKQSKGRLAAALVRRVAGGGAVANADDVREAWYDCVGADPTPRTQSVADSGELLLHTR